MGNQQTLTESALNKIVQLESEVCLIRKCLFRVAGLQLPKLRNLEFDYKYIIIHTKEKKQMKILFKKYTKDVSERIQKIFLISYQNDIQNNCKYLEEYLGE